MAKSAYSDADLGLDIINDSKTPNTYMQYGMIEGYTTTKGYNHMILVTNLDYHVTRSISVGPSGGYADAYLKNVNVHMGLLSFTKSSDIVSAQMYLEATIGVPEGVIFHVTTNAGEAGVLTIMKIELTYSLMENYAVTIQSGTPIECLGINYASLQTTTAVVGPDGKTESNQVYGYNTVYSTKM